MKTGWKEVMIIGLCFFLVGLLFCDAMAEEYKEYPIGYGAGFLLADAQDNPMAICIVTQFKEEAAIDMAERFVRDHIGVSYVAVFDREDTDEGCYFFNVLITY